MIGLLIDEIEEFCEKLNMVYHTDTLQGCGITKISQLLNLNFQQFQLVLYLLKRIIQRRLIA